MQTHCQRKTEGAPGLMDLRCGEAELLCGRLCFEASELFHHRGANELKVRAFDHAKTGACLSSNRKRIHCVDLQQLANPSVPETISRSRSRNTRLPASALVVRSDCRTDLLSPLVATPRTDRGVRRRQDKARKSAGRLDRSGAGHPACCVGDVLRRRGRGSQAGDSPAAR